MPDRNVSQQPSVCYRVQWWTKHPDGHEHTNHHDHTDLKQAEADLATVESVPHIVSATLTEIIVEQMVRRRFTRAGREVGAAGVFTD